jgi:hypothetical protein
MELEINIEIVGERIYYSRIVTRTERVAIDKVIQQRGLTSGEYRINYKI